MMRRLLVGSAHYILGPFGEDSDLRRHGEKIAGRGGKNAKKRTVVAVVRKLWWKRWAGRSMRLLICAEVAKRYGRIGSWTTYFREKPQTGAREDV
jgi:hypothetical protein